MDETPSREATATQAWDTLRVTVESLQQTLPSQGDCGTARALLDQVAAAHAALQKLEQALQGIHLACCVFPQLHMPAEVALALTHLSLRRTGALIVFEQHDRLDAYVEAGVVVDGQLSAELLESLFYPGNPMHDGAVIVRGARIMVAGAFLPVAAERRDPVHGRPLGARHRAALGLSRLTDAVLFIVSEETGAISLALDGVLVHSLNVHMVVRPEGGGRALPAAASQAPTLPSLVARFGGWVARGFRR